MSFKIVQAGSRSQVAMNGDADKVAVAAGISVISAYISDEGSRSCLKKRRSCRPGRQKFWRVFEEVPLFDKLIREKTNVVM